MKKFNLILILIFSCQLGIAQTKCQKVINYDSLVSQDYSLVSSYKNNSFVNTSINVKAIDYNKILEKFTKEKKFDFSKKSYNVKNLEINGLCDMVDLRIIEGVHIKFVDDKGMNHHGFSIFDNEKEKVYTLKNKDSIQKMGLVIYIEKKGKDKYLSDEEMNKVIEFLKSI